MANDNDRDPAQRNDPPAQKTGPSLWVIGAIFLAILVVLSVWAVSGPPNYEAQMDNKSTADSATRPNTGSPK